MSFDVSLTTANRSAVITLVGILDADSDDAFRAKVEHAANLNELDELVLDMSALEALSSAGVRAVAYARQRMDDEVKLIISSPGDTVRQRLIDADLDDSVAFRE